jgi:hypothetical protein
MSAGDEARESAGAAPCAGCPIGDIFGAAQGAQPEAMEHLLNAAHELIAAARVVLDAADQVVDAQLESLHNARAPRDSRLRRIDID